MFFFQLLVRLTEDGEKITHLQYGKTALINEAARGNIKNVLALIAAGANIDVQDLQFGKTALIEAVWRGHIDVAVALIAAGANVFIKDDNENTALIGSIWGGHTEISLALIKTCKEKCAIDVQYFEIILMAAAKRGQTEVAMALIAVGIDVNAKDALGKTALFGAVKNCYSETALALIAAGADLYAKTSRGKTPMSISRRKDGLRILKAYTYQKRRIALLASTFGHDGNHQNNTILRKLHDRFPYSWQSIIRYIQMVSLSYFIN